VVAAIKHFLFMLKGRQFVLFNDHKLLVGDLDGARLANSDSCLSLPSLHPASGISPASRTWWLTLSLVLLRVHRHHPKSSSFLGSSSPPVAVLARQAVGQPG
jgi:hypothetical protein